MSGYIGATTFSFDVTEADIKGDIKSTDASPEVTLQNTTEEDTDGGRESKITFKGEQSGGEITTLAQIQASHDGTADDEKGDLIFSTNDGADGNTPTERMRIDADGNVGIGTNAPTALLEIDNGGTSTGDVVVFNLGSEDREHSFENIIATGRDLRLNTARDYRIKYGADTAGFPTEGEMIFEHGTNGETMRIDSSGNVGIGQAPSTFSGWKVLEMKGGTNGAMLNFEDNSSTRVHVLASAEAGLFRMQTLVADPITFETNNTERMRIDSSGKLLVGTTSTLTGFHSSSSIQITSGSQAISCKTTGGSTQSPIASWQSASYGFLAYFTVGTGNTKVGDISTNGTTTSYNTTSDYRLKENVTDVTDGITRVKQLAPKRFNFIADPDTTVDGFIAHEAAIAVPEAVTGTQDAMRDEEYEVTPAVLDDDGNVVTEAVMGTRSVPEYQGIDQAKLVPLLTAALQEAIAKIETLETKVAALESA